MRSYTAAVIASTWPDEPPPTGVQYPNTAGVVAGPGEGRMLGAMLDEVGHEIRQLAPTDIPRQHLLDDCRQRYQDVVKSRWGLIESARGSVSTPFYRVLVFWLVIVFLGLGLCAPRGALSVIVIALAAVSITVAMYVILDLDLPYGGLFSIRAIRCATLSPT